MPALACDQVGKRTFPRRYRIARREGFSQILKSRPQTGEWFAVHWQPSDSGHARLGITISKRVEPSAVRRNRIKRLIRERFRSKSRLGQECDLVVRIRKQPDCAAQPGFLAALDSAFEKILTKKT